MIVELNQATDLQIRTAMKHLGYDDETFWAPYIYGDKEFTPAKRKAAISRMICDHGSIALVVTEDWLTVHRR